MTTVEQLPYRFVIPPFDAESLALWSERDKAEGREQEGLTISAVDDGPPQPSFDPTLHVNRRRAGEMYCIKSSLPWMR